MGSEADEPLLSVLRRAQAIGLLGPGDVGSHVRHARGMLESAGVEPRGRWADLGSGAGVPGLVLAYDHPELDVVLVDRGARRCEHLRWAVEQLGLKRVTVVEGDASEYGRDSRARGRFDGLVARGFGVPGVVAECAAPLLRVGGVMLVSEPPGAVSGRWGWLDDVDLGMGPAEEKAGPPAVMVARKAAAGAERYPRRWAAIRRRPLGEEEN